METSRMQSLLKGKGRKPLTHVRDIREHEMVAQVATNHISFVSQEIQMEIEA